MPRRLAISLLHEAQIAATQPFIAAIGARGLPQVFSMLDAGDVVAEALKDARARFASKHCTLWAIYLHRPSLPSAPVVADFDVEPGLLRLTSSLATKGVLQLRAWRLAGGKVVENPLQMED